MPPRASGISMLVALQVCATVAGGSAQEPRPVVAVATREIASAVEDLEAQHRIRERSGWGRMTLSCR